MNLSIAQRPLIMPHTQLLDLYPAVPKENSGYSNCGTDLPIIAAQQHPLIMCIQIKLTDTITLLCTALLNHAVGRVVSVLRQAACFSQSDTVASIYLSTHFDQRYTRRIWGGISLTALIIFSAHLFSVSTLHANEKMANHSAGLI